MRRIGLIVALVAALSVQAAGTSTPYASRVRKWVSPDPTTCSVSQIGFNVTTGLFKGCLVANVWTQFATIGSVGPVDATYITQTANTTLTAEQALAALATGYMKSAITTGVVTTQAVPIPVADGGTGATTLTANNVLLGNTASAVQFVAPGTSGNVLTSNGTTWASAAATSFAAAGSGSEIQARSTATTVQAVTGSSTLTGGIALVEQTAGNVLLSLTGASAQTGDLLDITANGGAAGGLFKVLAAGSFVGTGTANRIGTATTNDTTADTMFSASATGARPLVVQTKASSTTDGISLEKSDGTLLASIAETGGANAPGNGGQFRVGTGNGGVASGGYSSGSATFFGATCCGAGVAYGGSIGAYASSNGVQTASGMGYCWNASSTMSNQTWDTCLNRGLAGTVIASTAQNTTANGSFMGAGFASQITADATIQFGQVVMPDIGTDGRFDINASLAKTAIGALGGTGASAAGTAYPIVMNGIGYLAPDTTGDVARGHYLCVSSTAGYVADSLTACTVGLGVGKALYSEDTNTLVSATASNDQIVVTGVPNWVVGDPVIFYTNAGAAIAGLTSGNVYWVKTISSATVTLSATLGGAVTDITADGVITTQYLQRLPKAVINVQ